MKKYHYLILFVLAAIVCLIGRLVPLPYSWQIDYLSKPLLMPLLFLYYRSKLEIIRKVSFFEFVFSGLFFAWLGDLFLMIAFGDKLLFITGLLCFLVMQLQYIYQFNKKRQAGSSIFSKNPVLAVPSVALGLGFYILLFPKLGFIFKIAVGIYALSLATMTLAAINRYQKSSTKSFNNLTTGAFLFMVSDMMIGLKSFWFVQGFYLDSFWIMLTYISGQFLLFRGLILYQVKPSVLPEELTPKSE